MRRAVQALIVVGAALSCMACSSIEGPKAWEKGLLAKPEMTMESDALDARYTQHIYSSKEAATGGYGVGGGGCGCN
jgi:hypothetical protein